MINQLNRLAKAWGCKCTSDYVDEALDAICDDMPFGTKVETVEILAEQTVTLEKETDESVETTGAVYSSLNLEADKRYILNINGVKNEVTCNDITDLLGVSCLALEIINNEGNPTFSVWNILDESTVTSSGINYILNSAEQLTSVTISITTEQETVTPIPQKYLPEPVIFTSADEGETFTCNKTFAECLSIYKDCGYCTAYVYVMGQTNTVINASYSETIIGFIFQLFDGSNASTYTLLYNSDGTITLIE